MKTQRRTADEQYQLMMQNQHQMDMVTSDATAPAEASEEPKPQGTRFKGKRIVLGRTL